MVINTLTWKVRGVNAPTKRHMIWKYLLDQHYDIVAQQETHLKRSEDHRLKHKTYPLIYKSSASTGVAFLFHSSLKF